MNTQTQMQRYNAQKVGNVAALRSWKDHYTVSIYTTDGLRVDKRHHCKTWEQVKDVIYQKKQIVDKATGRIMATVRTKNLIDDFFTVADNSLRALVQKNLPATAGK